MVQLRGRFSTFGRCAPSAAKGLPGWNLRPLTMSKGIIACGGPLLRDSLDRDQRGHPFYASGFNANPRYCGTGARLIRLSFDMPTGGGLMAKSKTKTSSSKKSGNVNLDKLAKAAMSREMLAAGLTAAAAAIAASPKARRAIRDAGLDAADSASSAATSVMSSASKLGNLIAEAVAEAAQRVMSGKWSDDDTSSSSSAKPAAAKRAPAKRKTAKRSTAKKSTAAKPASAAKPRATAAKPRPRPAT